MSGELYVYVLKTGQAVLARESSSDDKYVHLTHPLQLVERGDEANPAERKMGLEPFGLPGITLGNPIKPIPLSHDVVFYRAEPLPNVAAAYSQATSGIQLARTMPGR